MSDTYAIACPCCGDSSKGMTRGNRNGWEKAWGRAVAHLVKSHGVGKDRAERLLARAQPTRLSVVARTVLT